ncbi:MAG: RHS repeat-associated core domain-containing protein, partial [Ardenticatenaceae bacterium]
MGSKGCDLGPAALLTTASGLVKANTTARYFPFGAFRAAPTAGIHDRGFTGHAHNNLPPDGVGLIYMNARFYVPAVGRFASADAIVPDPAEPASFNRFAYSYNSPTNYLDPSGHCGGDPNNNNPFDASGNLYYDCTHQNFDEMSIDVRVRWITEFMRQTKSMDWFNNILGILGFFRDEGLAGPGSWLSVVDASILLGVQEGYSLHLGFTSTSTHPGGALWKVFFDALNNKGAYLGISVRDEQLKQLWGPAEQASTDYGVRLALLARKPLSSAERSFLNISDIYRRSVGEPYLGGMLGAEAGGFLGGTASAALCVSACSLTGTIIGKAAGFAAGEWFTDPR